MISRAELAAWLRPTVVAPCATISVFVTGATALGLREAPEAGFWPNWVAAMAAGGILAAAVVAAFVGVDIALLRLNVRRLPSGRTAWATGAIAPLLVVAAYQLHGVGGPFVVEALVPAVVVAILLRTALGAPTS